jgi:hypothetical protein
MKMDDLKKVIAKLIRENFHQSISEATYDLGKKQYTEKNMTPTEILDLAMAYKNTPANKMLSGKLGNMVNVANDLAKLNGTTQLDAKTRGKNPALILFLLKNKLVTKEEYIDLYKELLTKQISVIKSLKNADPASRMVGGAAARQAHKDMKGEFDESVNEMSKNDVHFKEIMKMYDKGGSFTKKKVAVVVCKNPRASRRDIEEQLLDSDYNEITQYQDELQIAESVQGDKIQNLNNRIKALKDKISATKSSEQKSKFQNTLKNALQSLSNIRKAQTESLNEAASEEAKEIGALTGVRGDAVQKFIDDNNIHARKLLAYLKMKGPHTLSNRMDISTAIVGKANNKYAQGIIKAFSESKINEAKVGNPFGLAAKVLQSLGFTGGYVSWLEGISFEKQIKGGVLQITIVRAFFGEKYQFDAVFFPEITKSILFGLIKKKVIDRRNGKWVSKDEESEIIDLGTGMFELTADDYEKEIKTRVKNAIGKIHESIKLTSLVKEAKSDYEVYHDSYTSAINAAKAYAEKKGYTINDDDSFRKIGMGPKKPSEGKTNKFSIELSKDDKVQKKQLHIQVYGMKTKYELNCYIG